MSKPSILIKSPADAAADAGLTAAIPLNANIVVNITLEIKVLRNLVFIDKYNYLTKLIK